MSRRRKRAKRTEVAASPVPAGDRVRIAANAVMVAVVAVGGAYWASTSFRARVGEVAESAPRVVSPPPQPRHVFSESGMRVAEIDVEALKLWCAGNGLPEPPEIRTAEPTIAGALIGAMHQAATSRSPDAFGLVGRICEALDCYRNAEEYLNLAAAGEPSRFDWVYLLGCIHQESGRREQAVQLLTSALRLRPDYAVAHARLAQLHLEANRLDAAEMHAKQYAAAVPKDWLGPIMLGRIALRRGQTGAALRHLLRAADLGPNDFQTQYYLGKVYAAMGDSDEARERFDRASRLPKGAWFRNRDPLLIEADELAGGVSVLVDEFEKKQGSGDWAALARLGEEVIRRRPDDTMMMGNLASIYRKVGRLDAANKMLDRGLAIKGDSPRLLALRSEVYFTAKDYPRAVAAARRALELDPELALAYNVYARALYMTGKPAEAVDAMRRAVELDPDNAGKILVLGEFYIALGDAGAAAECYRRVLELVPENATARAKLDALERGGRP